MKLRSTIAATLVAALLGVGALAFAPAAGAQTAPTGDKQQFCQKAHDAWQKLVAANQKAVDEYHRLRAKQQELLANHHYVAAHKLDKALDAARRRHERIKDRVLAIAQKVKSFCSEQPPVLAEP